ncbi:MAG TPA: PEGA domain-containing protein, partial [Polyangiaceae bacterium]
MPPQANGPGAVPARPGWSIPPPPGPAYEEPSAAAAPVDMDWDDEDEKTTVYDRGNDDAARALLRSAPPPAYGSAPPPAYGSAPPPAYGSAPPPAYGALPTAHRGSPTMPPNRFAQARLPSAAPPAYAPLPRSAPPRGMSPTAGPVGPSRASASPFPEPKSGSGKPVLIALLSLLVVGLGAAVAILVLPKTGNLVVTVAGPGNKPVDAFQVALNGKERCRSSPCRIAELEPGTHLIRVTAPGYQPTAEQAVKVESGSDAVVHLALAQASEGTGIAVTAEGSGLTLIVDDREVGLLPQTIKDMTPGEHVIKIIDKNQRFKPFEQRVTVEPDKILRLEPKLKVAKGLAVIHAGDNASDARVLLVTGNERRPIPALPIKIDIVTDTPYSLLATKKGFQDYKQDITFEDGQAEKTFVVSLALEQEAEKEPASEAAEAPAPRAEAPA